MSLLLLFVVLVGATASGPLPYFSFRASSAHHRGELLGRRFSSEIAFAVRKDPSLPQLVAWAKANATLWSAIWGRQCAWFPSYCDEVEGMIAGARQASHELSSDADFALKLRLQNMEVDLLLLLPWVSQPIKCSDVAAPAVMGHNEDDDTFYDGKCAVIEDVADGWTAFYYPGELAGNAYGWNWRSGVVMSSNQLSPDPLNVTGAGYYFLARSVLDAASWDDAIARATQYQAFSGFSLNIGSFLEGKFGNAEVSLGRVKLTPAPVPHFNMYIYMNVSQQYDASSVTRFSRFRQMGSPTDVAGVSKFLSDSQVYRNGEDDVTTLSTVLFDFAANEARIYVGRSSVTQPLYKRKILAPRLKWKVAVSLFNTTENMWEPNACILPANGEKTNSTLVVFSTWLQPADQTQDWAPAIVAAASSNGGATFSPQKIIQDRPRSINGGQADPVCSSHGGIVYAAWMDNWSLSTSSSTDGLTWSSPVLAVETANASSGDSRKRFAQMLAFADKPWLVASKTGVHLTFNSQFPYVASSFDRGVTWTLPMPLLTAASPDPYYYYYAGGAGTLADGSSVLLHVAIPTNDPPFNASKPFGFVVAFFENESEGWVASTVAVLEKPIMQPCPASAQCNDRFAFISSSVSAYCSGKTVHVSWVAGNDKGLGVVYYSRSSDKGKTWSTPIAVSPLEHADTVYISFPAVAAASDEEVFVGYMSNVSGLWNTYVAHSGRSYALSAKGFVFPFGDYWRMVIDVPARVLHAVWGESVNGWFLNGTTEYTNTAF